jgi:hypothetical protein
MRFKSLPQSVQLAVTQSVVKLAANAPGELYLPVLPVDNWLAAFRALNIRIGRDYLPSSENIFKVVEYLEARSDEPSNCLKCGNKF